MDKHINAHYNCSVEMTQDIIVEYSMCCTFPKRFLHNQIKFGKKAPNSFWKAYGRASRCTEQIRKWKRKKRENENKERLHACEIHVNCCNKSMNFFNDF